MEVIGYDEQDYKLIISEDLKNLDNFLMNELENKKVIPGRYKIIIKSFLKKLASQKNINYAFSNMLNYIIIILAFICICLVIVNVSILIIIFWLYIVVLVFNINLQNKFRSKILKNLKSICIKYDNMLGNLYYVKVQIKNNKNFKFFDIYSLEIKIYVLLKFLEEQKNETNESKICYNTFPKIKNEKKKLRNSKKFKIAYFLDKTKIEKFSNDAFENKSKVLYKNRSINLGKIKKKKESKKNNKKKKVTK